MHRHQCHHHHRLYYYWLTARGASSPAKPALHMPEPLSITSYTLYVSTSLIGKFSRGWSSPMSSRPRWAYRHARVLSQFFFLLLLSSRRILPIVIDIDLQQQLRLPCLCCYRKIRKKDVKWQVWWNYLALYISPDRLASGAEWIARLSLRIRHKLSLAHSIMSLNNAAKPVTSCQKGG